MSEKEAATQKPDPFETLQRAQQAWMEAWSKSMSEFVASEAFAESLGQQVETYVDSTAPLRRQFEQGMELYFQQHNLATRADALSLAQRLTHVELRLDDLDAKLDTVLDHLAALREALPAASRNSNEKPAKSKEAGAPKRPKKKAQATPKQKKASTPESEAPDAQA